MSYVTNLTAAEERNLNSIIKKINSDSTGVKRYLCSTPLVGFARNNFDNILKADFFWKYMYYENERIAEEKEKLYAFLNNNAGKNTIFIVGYEGCGKTTFINALLEYYEKNQNYSKRNRILFDCGRHGANSESNPITRIFNQVLFKYIENNKNIIHNFIEFFRVNRRQINDLMNQDKMNSFYHRAIDFAKSNRNVNDPGHLQEIKNFVLSNFKIKDILYLIVFFALSKNFMSPVRKESLSPIVLFVDNLDYIENYEEMHLFVKALDDFTVEMSEDGFFRNLTLYKDSNIRMGFVDKIKIIIAMRETTKANLPVDHYSNIFNEIFETREITDWYDKDKIVSKRISLINSSSLLSNNKKKELEIIDTIMQDFVAKSIIIPLYNNDYRSTIDVITEIASLGADDLKEFALLISSKSSYVRYGARGIVLKHIFEVLNNKKNGQESCFKKIGVLDFTDRRNNSLSIARMILALLSNKTETRCDNGHNGISITDILEHFNDVLPAEKIKESLWNMYELKDSPKWTHLVSFSQIVTKSNVSLSTVPLEGIKDFDLLDFDKTLVHYSCAGKIYLELVSSHFEFFSTRCYPNNPKPALYCKANWNKDNNSEYSFINIIRNIRTQVSECCATLHDFNIEICRKRFNINNPYDYPNVLDYFNSPFVALYKDVRSNYSFHQYHESRIINAHIGYVDCFRLYILNSSDFPIGEKEQVNILLLKELEEYINLLGSILGDKKTKDELLPYYETMLNSAKNAPSDFSISINMLTD